jgi:3-oxoacyl-[acyl-carrier protein] reductase
VEISTYGAMIAAYHAAPHMVAAGRGSIVFVTATSGLQSYPSISSHAVGKAGIHALMQSLASELGEHGVRANAVAVGSIEGVTKRQLPVFDDPQVALDMQRASEQSRGALGRLVSEQEAAEAVLFLASQASAGMTGQIMAVDGGRIFH